MKEYSRNLTIIKWTVLSRYELKYIWKGIMIYLREGDCISNDLVFYGETPPASMAVNSCTKCRSCARKVEKDVLLFA